MTRALMPAWFACATNDGVFCKQVLYRVRLWLHIEAALGWRAALCAS